MVPLSPVERRSVEEGKDGWNALHHAIRGGHAKLALELMEAEPALSQAVNKDNESPMFIAVKNDCVEVFEKLAKTSNKYYNKRGGYGHNALHASMSVRKANSGETPWHGILINYQ